MLVGREQYAAMTIHHIGSANQLTQELGDSVTAVPVPCGPAGKAWSTYGDGSNAIFANCVNPEAAWQWISYLSSAPVNVAFSKLAGQMTVTTSGAKDWNLHPKRFVDATTQSLASARALPLVEQTADFVRTIWPQTNQEGLLGKRLRRGSSEKTESIGAIDGRRNTRGTACHRIVFVGATQTCRWPNCRRCKRMKNEIEESEWMPAIGVNSMTYTRPFTSEHYPLFRRMKAAGMDFCELLVPEEGEFDATEAGQAARQAGLSLVFAARINPHRDLAADDHAVHRSGVKYLRRCVDIAVAAGAKIVGGPLYGSPLVFAGRAPEPIDESDRLARIEKVVAGLKEAGDYAVQQGVELAIEPLNRFETDFCNTARQAVELVIEVGSPAVNVMLDTFHMNMEEDDLGRAIRRAAPYLVHFQANENHRGYLGTGHLNWAEICHVLAEIDYLGPIILEPFRRTETMLSLPLAQWRSPSYDEDLDLQHSGAFLRAALHSARRIL